MQIFEVPEFAQKRTIISLPPTATAMEAAKVLAENNIGAIPVVEDGKLVGVFSERDFIKRIIIPGKDPGSVRLNRIMTTNPDFISPDETVGKAINLMVTHHYRHMPVVENGKLVGFLSQRDFMALSWMELIKFKNRGNDGATT